MSKNTKQPVTGADTAAAPWPTAGARFEQLAMTYAASYLDKDQLDRLVQRGPAAEAVAAQARPDTRPSLLARLVRSLRGPALPSS